MQNTKKSQRGIKRQVRDFYAPDWTRPVILNTWLHSWIQRTPSLVLLVTIPVWSVSLTSIVMCNCIAHVRLNSGSTSSGAPARRSRIHLSDRRPRAHRQKRQHVLSVSGTVLKVVWWFLSLVTRSLMSRAWRSVYMAMSGLTVNRDWSFDLPVTSKHSVRFSYRKMQPVSGCCISINQSSIIDELPQTYISAPSHVLRM